MMNQRLRATCATGSRPANKTNLRTRPPTCGFGGLRPSWHPAGARRLGQHKAALGNTGATLGGSRPPWAARGRPWQHEAQALGTQSPNQNRAAHASQVEALAKLEEELLRVDKGYGDRPHLPRPNFHLPQDSGRRALTDGTEDGLELLNALGRGQEELVFTTSSGGRALPREACCAHRRSHTCSPR